MPRSINQAEELKRLRKADPAELWPVLSRLRTPLYAKLVEDCVGRQNQPLAHRVAEIVGEHYDRQAGVAPALDADQQEALNALASFWGVTPDEALRRLLNRLTQNDFLKLLIDFENRNRAAKEQLLAGGGGTKK